MNTNTHPVRALIGEMTEYLDQQVDPELDVIAKWRDRLEADLASAPPSAPAPAAGDAVAVDDATVDRYLRAIHLHLGGLTDAEVRKEKRAGVYEANAVRAGLTAAIAQDRASQAAAPSAPVGVEWPIIVEGLRLADRFFDGDDRYWKPASTVRAAYLAALAAQEQEVSRD